MHGLQYFTMAAVVAILSTSLYTGWFWWLIWILAHIMLACVGFYYAVQWNLVFGKNYNSSQQRAKKLQTYAVNMIIKKMKDLEASCTDQPRKVVISRSLDNCLQEVLDLISRHYILTWYEGLSKDKETLVKHAQTEMWIIVDKISRRLSEVDLVQFLSQDVLNCLHQHFRNIRLAKRNKDPSSERIEEECTKFMFHPWLKDDERELKCLRDMTDALLLLLLSKPYATCAPFRHLLREILAGSVLKPTIDLICDPDFINQKLLDYMAYREKMNADSKRTYMYSATYEGFVKMIKSTDSINDLKQMRQNIIAELLHASLINMLKKKQGHNTDKEVAPKGTNKGDLLRARDLERYKNQLTVAKQLCEKRIISLGGTVYDSSSDMIAKEIEIPGQKVIPFTEIMETQHFREYFMKFLKKEGAESYLGFWNAVEKLKTTPKDQHHQVATEVYQEFIASKSSLVKVDMSVLKGMEEFLRGNKGPEAFVTAQKQVQNHLEEHYYPSFMVSNSYLNLSASHQDILTLDDECVTSGTSHSDRYNDIEESQIGNQSYHAQQQLRALDVKITNKTRALRAQQASQKLDSNAKKLHEDMEQELVNLKSERKQLEMHIARTQRWIDNIGQWQAVVHDASVRTLWSNIFNYFDFILLVSLASGDQDGSQEVRNSTAGWAIPRSLEDFYALHEKLSQICSWLQKKELPSSGIIFKNLDNAFMTKAKTMLNEYLSAVMKDESLIHSEALYAFLSPNPEYVCQSAAAEKKSKFSLAALIKSLPNIQSDSQENEEDFMFSADDSSEKDKSTDSIAKPLYRFATEVFELQGVFRKTLMLFVEMTFGRSIDRQLKETVDQLISEQMLIYYIQLFKDSLWPDGQLAPPAPDKTEQQKQEDRIQAKNKLLENMPDTLKPLVGEENGRRGIKKMFEVLQNKNLNKHLFY
ncbi:unnamed protein product, partial [Lymnaea stagnalis]